VEHLPFQSAAFDAVLLSGVIHHFPDPRRFAREVFRVLKPGGCFVAFDPNRRNPFMYLYRDRSSPFYSSKGVTENERPVLAEEVVSTFADVGFAVTTKYQSKMHYNYVASGLARFLLPVYNFLDSWLFEPPFMARFRPFVLTIGTKPAMGEALTRSPSPRRGTERSADGASPEALAAWPRNLMDLLVCPISGERLRCEGPWLVNDALQIRYPIRDGIPMLLEQAGQGPDSAGKAA
jgi:SAM-dependent methyltransferase